MSVKSGSAPAEPSSPKRPSLRANFSWTAIGNVVYAACQWGVVTALAKLGTPEMVGQFALALAIATPVTQFLNLQLRNVQATDAKHEFEFSNYFTLRVLTTLIALAALLLIAILSNNGKETALIIALVALAKAIDSFSDVFYGAFQQRERMELISRGLIANGVLSLFMVTLGVWITGNLVPGIIGYTLGSLITLLFLVLPAARTLLISSGAARGFPYLRWEPERIRTLSIIALPLGVAMLIISLNANIPRYFVEYSAGDYGLGIFAALSYLIVAGTTVVSALGQSVSPRLSQHFAAGRTDSFMRMIVRLMAFGLGLGLAGAVLATLFGREILHLLYTEEYGEYTDVLTVLALAAGISFAASFAGYGMTAARRFRIQVPVFLVVLVTSVSLSALLIPRFKLLGASYVLLLSASVQLCVTYVVVVIAVRKRAGERG